MKLGSGLEVNEEALEAAFHAAKSGRTLAAFFLLPLGRFVVPKLESAAFNEVIAVLKRPLAELGLKQKPQNCSSANWVTHTSGRSPGRRMLNC